MSNCLKVLRTTGFDVILEENRLINKIQKFYKYIGVSYKMNGYMHIPYIILYYIRANMKAQ